MDGRREVRTIPYGGLHQADDFLVRRYGNIAIITGRSEYFIGLKLVGAVRHTQVWVERKERWQMVSWQGTSIPPPPPQK